MFYGFDWTYVVFILPCVIIHLYVKLMFHQLFQNILK